ncbi:alpha-galactosidase [Lysinimonas soli]|uniref:alpha-galactosidase n=1 Tax=Lysinimonas soli TaxID=1074233 RepID=A0ABW0NT08_9MICO
MRPLYLRGGGSALLIDLSGEVPAVIHWGRDLGDASGFADASVNPVPHSFYDAPVVTELVPQASSGWRGRPALLGHRPDGTGFSPRFRTVASSQDGGDALIRLRSADESLELEVTLSMSPRGMLRMRHELINTSDLAFHLDGLNVVLPVGAAATEVVDLTGRWCREQHPQRQELRQGTWLREYRHGRTGHDSSVLTMVGTEAFSNRRGEVWATHFGYSGNRASYVEKTAAAPAMIGTGQLFSPGELELAPGASYRTPWLYAAHSTQGIDGLSEVFHDWIRARPTHPRSARPVVLNTWEAVYFDHDLETLRELARAAARLGVERFVLDDGWFRGRRSDLAGLGDWTVDERVWPGGLDPLIDEVVGQGMQFGLWVEPEMVNVDSEVIREHSDWISGPGDRLPTGWRHQQVIDLVNPDAWQHVYSQIDTLLSRYRISYLKWDQNRDLVEEGHRGAASSHRQMEASYRLFDALKRAHPDVEIESCSSGGARVDLGILERTDRVWASDCNDALERQTIQRWTQALLPPELVGTHVGPPLSHTTARTHSLSFRAITAMFGHFGIEWDIRALDQDQSAELAAAIALYQRHRGLLHSGVSVHADLSDDAYAMQGVVAVDRAEALYSFVCLRSARDELPGRIGFPGLDPRKRYRVAVVFPTVGMPFEQRNTVPWTVESVVGSGAFLGEVGLPMPILLPENGILLHVTEVAEV